MKPPICSVCNTRIENDQQSAGLISFADYRALPESMVGHPHGLAWFCADHYSAAKLLTHLKMAEAIKQLK